MELDGYHSYRVDLKYKQKDYSGEFLSTVLFSPQIDPIIAWGIADECIKSILETIPNRVRGVYPYDIKISGEFGEIKIN